MVHVRQLLRDPGLFDPNGRQLRPVTRTDVDKAFRALYLFTQNGIQPATLQFDGLDLDGADLRGLDPSGNGPFQVSFINCQMRNVLAGPSVEAGGRELAPHDLAYQYAVMLWATGQLEQLKEFGLHVRRTQLGNVLFVDTQLEHADFSHAQMGNANLSRVAADDAVFNGCELRGADLSFAKLSNTSLLSSDLSGANLLGSELTNCKLDGIQWGAKQIVVQERDKNWPQAHLVYRHLTEVHEIAGLDNVASQFRYLRERALTRAIFATTFAPMTAPIRSGFAHRLVAVTRERRRFWGQWLLRRFVEWLFGYSERPFRVTRAIAIVVLGFAPLYFVPSSFDLSFHGFGEFSIRIAKAIYFSAASTSALGYGSWVDPSNELGRRVYFGVAQSFIGIFLNALFLVTFIRKWVR